MDQTDYIRRMEAAVFNSNKAMKVLREECQKLRQENESLILEREFLMKKITDLESQKKNISEDNRADGEKRPKIESFSRVNMWSGLSKNSLNLSNQKNNAAAESPALPSHQDNASNHDKSNTRFHSPLVNGIASKRSLSTHTNELPSKKIKANDNDADFNLIETMKGSKPARTTAPNLFIQGNGHPNSKDSLAGDVSESHQMAYDEIDKALDEVDIGLDFSDDTSHSSCEPFHNQPNRRPTSTVNKLDTAITEGRGSVVSQSVRSNESDSDDNDINDDSNSCEQQGRIRPLISQNSHGAKETNSNGLLGKDISGDVFQSERASDGKIPATAATGQKELGWEVLPSNFLDQLKQMKLRDEDTVSKGAKRDKKTNPGKEQVAVEVVDPAVQNAGGGGVGVNRTLFIRGLFNSMTNDNIFTVATILRCLPVEKVSIEVMQFVDTSTRNIATKVLRVAATAKDMPSDDLLDGGEGVVLSPIWEECGRVVDLCVSLVTAIIHSDIDNNNDGKQSKKQLSPLLPKQPTVKAFRRRRRLYLGILKQRTVALVRHTRGDFGILGLFFGPEFIRKWQSDSDPDTLKEKEGLDSEEQSKDLPEEQPERDGNVGSDGESVDGSEEGEDLLTDGEVQDNTAAGRGDGADWQEGLALAASREGSSKMAGGNETDSAAPIKAATVTSVTSEALTGVGLRHNDKGDIAKEDLDLSMSEEVDSALMDLNQISDLDSDGEEQGGNGSKGVASPGDVETNNPRMLKMSTLHVSNATTQQFPDPPKASPPVTRDNSEGRYDVCVEKQEQNENEIGSGSGGGDSSEVGLVEKKALSKQLSIAYTIVILCKLILKMESPGQCFLFLAEATLQAVTPCAGLIIAFSNIITEEGGLIAAMRPWWLELAILSVILEKDCELLVAPTQEGVAGSHILREVLKGRSVKLREFRERTFSMMDLMTGITGNGFESILDLYQRWFNRQDTTSNISLLADIRRTVSQRSSPGHSYLYQDSRYRSCFCFVSMVLVRNIGINDAHKYEIHPNLLETSKETPENEEREDTRDNFLESLTVANYLGEYIRKSVGAIRALCDRSSTYTDCLSDRKIPSMINLITTSTAVSSQARSVRLLTYSVQTTAHQVEKDLEASLTSQMRNYLNTTSSAAETTLRLEGITSSMRSLDILNRSMLEYDRTCMSWLLEGNFSGNAIRVEIEINNKIHYLKKVLCRNNISLSNPNILALEQSQLQEIMSFSLTNVSPILLFSAAQTVDETVSILLTSSIPAQSTQNNSQALQSTTTTFTNVPVFTLFQDSTSLEEVKRACLALVSCITVAVFERLLAVTSLNLRALIKTCLEESSGLLTGDRSDDARYNRVITMAIEECIRLQQSLPPPWDLSSNASFIPEIITAIRKMTELSSSVTVVAPDPLILTPYPRIGNLSYSMKHFLHNSTRKLPAFVINLDRRFDRWRKLQQQCVKEEILPVRVSAIDGKDLEGNESDVVPLSDVCKYWDSTLNSKFDLKCQCDKNTAMTNSERGCAGSHVLIWRMIYELFHPNRKKSIRKLNYDSVELFKMKRLWEECRFNEGWSPKRLQVSSGTKEYLATLGRHNSSNGNTRTDRESSYFLILEDDAVFLENDKCGHPLRCRVNEIIQKVPADFDILYLGYAMAKNASLRTNIHVSLLKSGFFRPSYLWQLHAYILTPEGARKLLANLPVDGPVDNYIARLINEGKIEAYVVKEQMVKQGSSLISVNGKKKDSNIVHSGKSWRRS